MVEPLLSLNSTGRGQLVNMHIAFETHGIFGSARSWKMYDDTIHCRANNNQLQSKKGGKDQESIQSGSTPDPGYHMGK